jgi:hypothetical protein
VTLQNFLIERHRTGPNTVLILDEAQNLYPQTLEQIRLLSNFETTKEKILQIILVGQPELLARLDMPELRQLQQRIGMICSIPPMTRVATRNYIRTRLRTAGAPDLGIFGEDSLQRIAEYAEGIPRVVNTVCDHCLLIGYADQTRRIDADIVEQAIEYLEVGRRPRPRQRRREGPRVRSRTGRARPASRASSLRWGLVGMSTALVAGVVAVAAIHPGLLPQVMDLSTSYLSDLARTVMSLVSR